MFSSTKVLGAVSAALLLCTELVSAGGPLCVANRCPKKRDLFGDVNVGDANLVKRQADPYATIYPLVSIPAWAALPYSSCGATSGGTKTICPLEYYCHCHSGTSSLCMPTRTVAPATITTCSTYTGPKTCSDCEFYWSTTLSQMVSQWAQCGGYSSNIITQAWDVKTLCPVNHRCNPLNFWYSQCIPATMSQTPVNPQQYWVCTGQTFSYATAQYDKCGGHCFKANGMADGICPSGQKCWTKTSTLPGYDATCYSSSPAGGNWATNLCYPIPYEWPGYGAPTCTPQTGLTQTPYGQCRGSTINNAGSSITWNGPTNCPCGFQCTSYNPSYGICNNIPNFPSTGCNTVGAGTQTLYGRCGGSSYSNGSAITWSSPTLCQPGATCVTDQGGWYAQCTSLAKNRKRSPVSRPEAHPAALPYANAAPEPTAAATFARRYEEAAPAHRPRTA